MRAGSCLVGDLDRSCTAFGVSDIVLVVTVSTAEADRSGEVSRFLGELDHGDSGPAHSGAGQISSAGSPCRPLYLRGCAEVLFRRGGELAGHR
jgi:hypothetical protein